VQEPNLTHVASYIQLKKKPGCYARNDRIQSHGRILVFVVVVVVAPSVVSKDCCMRFIGLLTKNSKTSRRYLSPSTFHPKLACKSTRHVENTSGVSEKGGLAKRSAGEPEFSRQHVVVVVVINYSSSSQERGRLTDDACATAGNVLSHHGAATTGDVSPLAHGAGDTGNWLDHIDGSGLVGWVVIKDCWESLRFAK
jgi:hypothetical protein